MLVLQVMCATYLVAVAEGLCGYRCGGRVASDAVASKDLRQILTLLFGHLRVCKNHGQSDVPFVHAGRRTGS